jgi:Domain of unknown function (DUF4041)
VNTKIERRKPPRQNTQLDQLINDLAFDVPWAIQEYVSVVLSNSVYPDSFAVEHDFRFDLDARELTLTARVVPPDNLPTVKEYRYVKAKDEITPTGLPIREQKARYASAVSQVAVRTLHEIFEADRAGRIRTISLTGGHRDDRSRHRAPHRNPSSNRRRGPPNLYPLRLEQRGSRSHPGPPRSGRVQESNRPDARRHLPRRPSAGPVTLRSNPPPGWPTPPPGWTPPSGWRPDPSWPEPPPGWQLWLDDESVSVSPPPNGDRDLSPTESALNGSYATVTARHAAPETTLEPANVDRSFSTPASTAPPASTPLELVSCQGERARLLARITELEGQLQAARGAQVGVGTDVVPLNDQEVFQEVGIYRYHHPLENAAAYRERLTELNARIDSMIKIGKPVLAADLFTFDGSLAKGRRMVADQSKLMLRAYNAEADNCVRSLRSGNVITAKRRLDAAVTAIARLGAIMETRINPEYHALRAVSASRRPIQEGQYPSPRSCPGRGWSIGRSPCR